MGFGLGLRMELNPGGWGGPKRRSPKPIVLPKDEDVQLERVGLVLHPFKGIGFRFMQAYLQSQFPDVRAKAAERLLDKPSKKILTLVARSLDRHLGTVSDSSLTPLKNKVDRLSATKRAQFFKEFFKFHFSDRPDAWTAMHWALQKPSLALFKVLPAALSSGYCVAYFDTPNGRETLARLPSQAFRFLGLPALSSSSPSLAAWALPRFAKRLSDEKRQKDFSVQVNLGVLQDSSARLSSAESGLGDAIHSFWSALPESKRDAFSKGGYQAPALPLQLGNGLVDFYVQHPPRNVDSLAALLSREPFCNRTGGLNSLDVPFKRQLLEKLETREAFNVPAYEPLLCSLPERDLAAHVADYAKRAGNRPRWLPFFYAGITSQPHGPALLLTHDSETPIGEHQVNALIAIARAAALAKAKPDKYASLARSLSAKRDYKTPDLYTPIPLGHVPLPPVLDKTIRLTPEQLVTLARHPVWNSRMGKRILDLVDVVDSIPVSSDSNTRRIEFYAKQHLLLAALPAVLTGAPRYGLTHHVLATWAAHSRMPSTALLDKRLRAHRDAEYAPVLLDRLRSPTASHLHFEHLERLAAQHASSPDARVANVLDAVRVLSPALPRRKNGVPRLRLSAIGGALAAMSDPRRLARLRDRRALGLFLKQLEGRTPVK